VSTTGVNIRSGDSILSTLSINDDHFTGFLLIKDTKLRAIVDSVVIIFNI
jgi:hypothetical protein